MTRSLTTIDRFARIDGLSMKMFLDMDIWLDSAVANKQFETCSVNFLKRFLKHDMVCVDVGANIGYYTLIMAFLCRKVYVFEPMERFFDVTRKNCEKNGFMDKVILSNCALSDCEKRIEIFSYDQSATMHPINPKDAALSLSHVSCKKMDDVITEKIDFIKVDCDGHDPFVVLGANYLISKYHPTILIEVAPQYYDNAGFSMERFYDHMIGLGYDVYADGGLMKLDKPGFMRQREQPGVSSFNVVCMPSKAAI